MGTRGLLGHIVRGRKRAAYTHFGSYPVGLGQQTEDFMSTPTEGLIE